MQSFFEVQVVVGLKGKVTRYIANL